MSAENAHKPRQATPVVAFTVVAFATQLVLFGIAFATSGELWFEQHNIPAWLVLFSFVAGLAGFGGSIYAFARTRKARWFAVTVITGILCIPALFFRAACC